MPSFRSARIVAVAACGLVAAAAVAHPHVTRRMELER